MAFEHPIESDIVGVDDFNLFSAFVRAPLWILGGVLGGKKSSPDNKDDEISPAHHRIEEQDENSRREALHPQPQPPQVVHNPLHNSLRRTKNLSWSDESGHSLVEYNDEVSLI